MVPSPSRPKVVQRRTLVAAIPDREPIRKASSLIVRLLSPLPELQSKLGKLARVPCDNERKVFADAIRDGYLLCLLLNVLRPAVRLSPQSDPSRNISAFLSTCISLGVPKRLLFSPDDAPGTIASSILNIVEFIESKPPSSSPISSRAAASTPNLLRDRPLPSTPRQYPTPRIRRQPVAQPLHDDDSDADNPLSTHSTPLNFSPPKKPPPKSPLRKSLTASPPSSPLPSRLPNSPTISKLSSKVNHPSSGLLSLVARPVSNLRASLAGPATTGGSSLNLPGLVSGLGSAASNLVTLRKPSTKSPSNTQPTLPKSPTTIATRSQTQTQTQRKTTREAPTIPTPSTPIKIKPRTQSPLPSPSSPTRTRTHSPSPLPASLLVQDARRSPTSLSSPPRTPTLIRTPTSASPRSPTRMRSSTATTSIISSTRPDSDSPTRLRGQGRDRDAGSSTPKLNPIQSGAKHDQHQAHHQPTLTGLNHHPSHHASNQHPNHPHTTGAQVQAHASPSLSHTKSVQSIQSMNTTLSEGTTVLSAKSSLLDLGGRWNGYAHGMHRRPSGEKYGTIRTVTTELTEPPVWDEDRDSEVEFAGGELDVEDLEEVSMRADESIGVDGDCWVEEVKVKLKVKDSFKFPVVANGNKKQDLSRVNEVEEDESTSGCERRSRERERERERERNRQKSPVNVYLGQGKFPDDFMDVFGKVSEVRRSAKREQERDETQPQKLLPSTPPPIPMIPPSPSPPKKLAIVGSNETDFGSSGAAAAVTPSISTTPIPTGGFPRRPTHWSRRSVDVPLSSSSNSIKGEGISGSPISAGGGVGLLPRQKPKEGSEPRVQVPRRHSTSATRRPLGGVLSSSSPTGSPSGSRSGSGRSAGSGSGGSGSNEGVQGGQAVGAQGSVPFPRTVSAEYYTHSQANVNAGAGRGLSSRTGVGGGRGRTPSPSPRSSDPLSASAWGPGGGLMAERTRMVRERYQSNIEGSSGNGGRRRPSSYDEVGLSAAIRRQQPQGGAGGRTRLRSRFESMTNLTGPSGGDLGNANASASVTDLMAARESIVSSEGGFSVSTNGAGRTGSGSKKRLVIREDGKPPTQYQLGNCIGRGQFGSVYRALNENTGQMVAVKRIRLEGLKEEDVTQLMKEVDLVKSLSHPSVVKYEGMLREEGMLNIVLEYAENGSLGQTLKSFGALNEPLVARYVVKILEGLHYLHTSNIVHCDLKAANILTTKNGNVKLTDFGVSLNLRAMERERGCVDEHSRSGGRGQNGDRHGNVAGTPNWMAPEVIELKGASTKSDIWSLGCTVVELLTGRPPYADVGNAMSVMFRIVENPMPPLPENCDALLKDFLIQCFNKNPALRPSAEELCEHPWLKKNWSAFKDLKAQDSIPWIRRISADFPKSDAIRYLSQLEIPDSPLSASPKDRPSDGEFSPREHSFVKTTFSKPMICRVCLSDVKKSALICGQCSLISHSKCAPNSPPTCDLRAQLLLFAQYAEKGNPSSVYSNPAIMNLRNNTKQNVALSDVAFVEHSRTSLDGPPLSPPASPVVEHPPTAFKFMAAFKRSKSNLSPEPTNNDEDGGGSNYTKPPAMQRLIKRSFSALHPSSPSPPPPPPPPLPLPPASERPVSSVASCSSSLSVATANESFSSRQNTGGRSQVSSPVSGGSGSGGRSVSSHPGGGVVVVGVGVGDVPRRKSNRTVAVLETVPGSRPATAGASEVVEGGVDEEESEEGEVVEAEAEAEDAHVPGGLVEPKKRKRSTSSGNCMVQ